MSVKTGPKALLSAAQAAQVAQMGAHGYSDAQIARQFGVSRSTIQRVRSTQPVPTGPSADSGEALAEYRELSRDAFARASHGEDVSEEIAYLKEAEEVLSDMGVTREDGRPLHRSTLAVLAQRAAQRRR